MNTDNNTYDSHAWEVLGALELPIGASVEDIIHGWLTDILQPLHLQVEQLGKVIVSAQDAVVRAVQAANLDQFEHIHLIVFVPSKRDAKTQAWGFFRLEKIEDLKDQSTVRDHTVAFYLYGEGA